MSEFIKLKCKKCGNEQITFSHATMEVRCEKCNAVLLYPMGGKATLGEAEVVERYG